MNQQQIPVRPPYPPRSPRRWAVAPRPTAPYWLKAVAVFALCVALISLTLNGAGSVDGVRGDHLMVAPPFVITEVKMDEVMAVLREVVMKA